jgi:hypothetical protein
MDGRKDFDFQTGRWRVRNSRLARRLEGCTEWQEFDAECAAHALPGGMGNIDYFDCARFYDGKPLHGVTLRLFDPTTRLWSIHWADDRSHQLQPPVIGRFVDGRGVFVGDDTFAGRPIRVRFIWTVDGRDAARWEQAFSTDGEKTWEANWRMWHTRQNGAAVAPGNLSRRGFDLL